MNITSLIGRLTVCTYTHRRHLESARRRLGCAIARSYSFALARAVSAVARCSACRLRSTTSGKRSYVCLLRSTISLVDLTGMRSPCVKRRTSDGGGPLLEEDFSACPKGMDQKAFLLPDAAAAPSSSS